MRRDGTIVCFGEVLLRLAAPGAEMLLQTPNFRATLAGAEANVAVSLARLGHATAMVTTLPDNAIGQAARDELRRHGVDTRAVALVPGRMGLYFLSPGGGMRPSQVIYDRAGSAFAVSPADAVDWPSALQGAGWLHVSGITPAVGPGPAASALTTVKAARAAGLTVSFDCNYRPTLWRGREAQAPAVLAGLLAEADVVFGDHRDIGLVLGRSFPGEGDAPRAAAAQAAFETWPNLSLMASTRRVQHSLDHHDLCGFLYARDGAWSTRTIAVTAIVDRIGAGDAFAAGLIHGLRRGAPGQGAIDFALAAAALKHTVPGDFNLVTEAEIDALVAGEDLGVRR
ncbi:MAG TPA: sugar kinase [Caulobacteraceae bacterium]|nr:sugar kinase [Caulobacteraceae bacterium]